MMRFICVLVMLCGVCNAADTTIKLPVSIVPDVPAAITELKEDSWFVIEADVPCIVLASRSGFVSIVPEKGPLRLRGKFVDGTGKIETRTYAAKNLWIIEPLVKGEVELLVVPNGAVDEQAVIRRTLVVGGGVKPVPPKPDPIDPTPTPPKPDITTASSLIMVIVENSLERTVETAAILADIGYFKSLEPFVTKVHIVPSDNKLAAQYDKQITTAGGKLPVVILMNAETKQVLAAKPLPADKVALSALVNSHITKKD